MAALNLRRLVGVLALCVLAGCAPSPWKTLLQGEKTADLVQAGWPDPRAEPLPQPGVQEACEPLPEKVGESGRLPNPVFTLHVAERILGQSLVPAYRTRFHLYPPPTPWALPQELAVPSCELAVEPAH